MNMMRSLAAAMLVLASATAVFAADPPKVDNTEKSADSGDKRICKRFLETGSLVKGYRTCKTKREWEREREAIRSVSSSVNSCANMGQSGSC
jgi:predicted transglutaminase-like cysteine proteinase